MNKILLLFLLIFCLTNLNGQLLVHDIAISSEIEEGSYNIYLLNFENGNPGENYTCKWDFGDGGTKTLLNGFNTGYAYQDDGNRTINLRIEESGGSIYSVSSKVVIKNVAPEIRFLNGKNTDFANRRAEFEAVVFDPGADAINYKWDFGDGSTMEGIGFDVVTHSYDVPGVYSVLLTVDDGDGGTDTERMTISVEYDWYGSITGAVNETLSGGSSILYQTRIDTITKEVTSCFKAITLFDDNNNSFFWIFNKSLNRLTDDEHNIGKAEDEYQVFLRYDLMKSLYANQQSHFRMQDVEEDWTQLIGSSFQTLSLMPDMIDAARTGKDVYGLQFESVSGKIKFEPLTGDRLRGTVTALLCDHCDSQNPESPPKQVKINLTFNIRVNKVAAYHMGVGCEDEINPFSILDFSTFNEKVNVNPEDPCLEVTFSEDIDPNSISNNNIKLGYYDNNEQFKIEDIAIDYTEGSKILIIPKDNLRKAVKYQVIIEDGPDGLKSYEGGQLVQGGEWTFSTLVEPNELAVNVYQSVADAPLIEDKNTMVRLLLNWEKPNDISDWSFVTEFPATIKLKGSGKNLTQDEVVVIKHQSQFNRQDTTHARNTQNIFSWKPKPSDGTELKIEIIPNFQDCATGGEDLKYEVLYNLKHAGMKPKLKMHYYYLSSGIIDIVNDVNVADMYNYVNKNNRFSEQLYPIYSIEGTYKGSLYAEEIFDIEIERLDSILKLEKLGEGGVMAHQLIKLLESGTFDFALERFYNELILNSDADIVVFIYSFKYGAKGNTYRSTSKGFKPIWGKEFVTIRFDTVYKQMVRPTLAHELGHSWYLEHVPYANNAQMRSDISKSPFDHWEDEIWHDHINGFRISPNGDFGYNKSCSEGNAQANVLTSIMFPSATNVFYKEPWIDRRQYDKALNHIKKSGKGLTFHIPNSENDFEYAALDPIQFPADDQTTVYISGTYNTETNAINIKTVQPSDKELKYSPESGFLTLQCLGKDGNVLASQSFNPIPEKVICEDNDDHALVNFYTSINLPKKVEAASFRILEQNKRIAEYIISVHRPELEVISPVSNDTLAGKTSFIFSGRDLDNDNLIYKVFYSSNGMQDWKLIKLSKETNANIDVDHLMSGENPVFKIEASDGYHTTSILLPVHIDFPLSMEWYTPSDTLENLGEIAIKFSNPIKASSQASQWFKFLEKSQNGKISEIPYKINYSSDYYTVTLDPINALDPQSEYQISYRRGPSKKELAEAENKQKVEDQKKKGNPLQRFLNKQVDRITSDDENKDNAIVLREILGLPTEGKTTQEEERKETPEKPNILEELILGKKVVNPEYLIEDIFGNKLTTHFSWKFKYSPQE